MVQRTSNGGICGHHEQGLARAVARRTSNPRVYAESTLSSKIRNRPSDHQLPREECLTYESFLRGTVQKEPREGPSPRLRVPDNLHDFLFQGRRRPLTNLQPGKPEWV